MTDRNVRPTGARGDRQECLSYRYGGIALFIIALLSFVTPGWSQTTRPVAVIGETVYTMTGQPLIRNGVVLIDEKGKIAAVGADLKVPEGATVLRAKVVTPGLIDAHTIVGLQGFRNEPREQDQLEKSAPMQPELRSIDAYNARERLVEWVRGFGITTIQTGPQPGALMPGQMMIIKTRGTTVDDGLLNPESMVCVTLGDGGKYEDGRSPGTRPKEIAMLRGELIKVQEYDRKHPLPKPATAPATADASTQPTTTATTKPATQPAADTPDLHRDVLLRVIRRQEPLLITAHRAQDILLALKLAKEFDVKIVLDGASECYLMLDAIKSSGVPIILHPTMFRSGGEAENLSFETAGKLKAAGIPFAIQSAYEDYVPKTRIVLFEAAIAAKNGLSFNDALASITIDAARILGIDNRVGSLTPGKDADLALYDGDPFEYASHCVGTIIDGEQLSSGKQ